jgi:hypothetical protein
LSSWAEWNALTLKCGGLIVNVKPDDARHYAAKRCDCRWRPATAPS